MSSTVSLPENRVTLSSISWEQYLAVIGEDEHDGRVAFHKGILEIMTAGSEHESIKRLVSRLIDHYTFVKDVEIHPVGNFTMKREELEAGVEADDCYYIHSIGKVRDFYQISLPEDPPPDLVVEIVVTNPGINKLAIYAAIGVPEIWRYRDGSVEILLRQNETSYTSAGSSSGLPGFPLAALNEALKSHREGASSNKLLKDFSSTIG